MPEGKRMRSEGDDDLVDWFTVSYKTIYLGVGALVLIGAAVAYYFFRSPRTTPTVIATPAATVTTARFTTLEGSVKVKTVGTFEWVSADRNVLLQKGDLVRTGGASAAEITFFDGTVVHVRPDSLITIEETSEDPSTKRRRVAWHVSSGEVNFRTVRQNVPGSATEISTPTIKATAGEQTDGGVRVAEAGDSDVRVYRGTSQVETKTGEKIVLGSSEGLRVDAAGKATARVTLPGVPEPQAPPQGAEISYPDPARASTLLAWKPVPGAAAYHVMVDYNAYFNRPVFDRKENATSVPLRLDPGKYYWRVAAVDKQGIESNFSNFYRFTLAAPSGPARTEGPPPMLVIDAMEVRINVLQVKGKTEPGASVTINGQKVDVNPDGTFNEFITLDKAGKQTVTIQAAGVNGGVNEQRRSVVVGF
ncbi:MAG TPA: FecR domain-containing protein [Vicinamibacteria bacterium]|jgi:hypothetical protein